MMPEILNMMKKDLLKKICKNNQIHQNIRHKINEAKNSWLANQCREDKELHAKYDVFYFHKKLEIKRDY